MSQMYFPSSHLKVLLLSLATFILGLLTSRLFPIPSSIPISFQETRHRGQYQFINPLLECDQANFDSNTNLNNLRNRVKNLVSALTASQKASLISVYYRNLNNGPWFGINEKEDFSPASLVKVPLMMAYFKLAESDPKALEKNITNNLSPDREKQNIQPKETLVPNQNYTVNDLIYRMIVYSDNLAYDLLVADIQPNILINTYNDLGIDISDGFTNPSGNILSVKDYASFFRILFNSSYLGKIMSEKALELLSQVEFKSGLTAALPPTTTVSHKFGERQFLATGEKQLHDCGIIYTPDPYLLCIMTRGKNFDTLADSIAQISSLVYSQLQNKN